MAAAILMPKLGLTMEVGLVVSWRKKEGERVQKDEPILEVETDKIVTDVQSPQAGVLLKVLVAEGAEVKVQTVLAVVGEPGEDISAFLGAPAAAPSAAAPRALREAAPEAPAAAAEGGRQKITPRARKLLSDKGFSPADLEYLGKARISEADVQEFLAGRGAAGRPTPAPRAASEPAGQLRPMGRIEKIVSERMTQSFRDIPQFSVRLVAAVDRLDGLRDGGTVSWNDLILRAVAMALARFPDVQCQYRSDGIFSPADINLGFAVSVGRDLLVPVIRNADRKKARQIAQESASLIARAREHRLLPDDLAGGTFTVSNLGMYGITSFTPIVNPGEGAILGVGAIVEAARVQEGRLVAGRVVELTLVCDHRAVNGAAAAEFCRTLKTVIESEEKGSW